jgi:hypothetical protein
MPTVAEEQTPSQLVERFRFSVDQKILDNFASGR